MRFVHISDTHLGFRQYGLDEREDDFYSAFEQAVGMIIEERPDFVIHSGDMFDNSRPPPKSMLVAQSLISQLEEKGIPLFLVPGNHDILMRKNFLPPQVLYKLHKNVRLISPENNFFVHDGVFIGGIPFMPRQFSLALKERMSSLASLSEKYRKRILVLHQGIDKYLPYDFEVGIGDIPQCFDYYALGHIHKRIVQDFGRGKLAYAGSTEMWSMDEYANYLKQGKGFYVVDLSSEAEVHKVDIDLPRKVIKESIEAGMLDEKIREIKESAVKLAAKPLIFLNVSGVRDAKVVHEKILSSLSDVALSVRSVYEDVDEAKSAEAGHSDISEYIQKSMGEHSSLASGILHLLSLGDEESALDSVRKYYEEFK